jgi:hypothetical protein
MFAAALSQAKALLSHNERKNPDLLQEVALALLEQANAGKELMPDEAVRMARNRETSFYLKSNKIFDPEAEVNIDPDLIPPTIRRCCGFTEYSEFSEFEDRAPSKKEILDLLREAGYGRTTSYAMLKKATSSRDQMIALLQRIGVRVPPQE